MTFAQERDKNPLDVKIKSLLSEPDRAYSPYNWSEVEVLLRPETKPMITLAPKYWAMIGIGVLAITVTIWIISRPSQVPKKGTEAVIENRYTPLASEFQFEPEHDLGNQMLVVPEQEVVPQADSLTSPAAVPVIRDTVQGAAVSPPKDSARKVVPPTEKSMTTTDTSEKVKEEPADDGFQPYQFNAPDPSGNDPESSDTARTPVSPN